MRTLPVSVFCSARSLPPGRLEIFVLRTSIYNQHPAKDTSLPRLRNFSQIPMGCCKKSPHIVRRSLQASPQFFLRLPSVSVKTRTSCRKNHAMPQVSEKCLLPLRVTRLKRNWGVKCLIDMAQLKLGLQRANVASTTACTFTVNPPL